MVKKVIFRADGNSKTGLGHLYRVFAIIEMLKPHYEYVLVTRSDSELIIVPKSYNLNIIPSHIDSLKEPEWLSKKYKASESVIIADGYTYDSVYQKKIKRIGYKLIYIDDLTTSKMYADIVVNHSLVVKPENFNANPETKFALGSKYAMLRPKFIDIAKQDKKTSTIEEVFVSFGGADFFDLTSMTVKALVRFKSIKKIHVLIGAAYKHEEIYKIENENIIIHKNLPETEVLNVLNKCQLAIIPSSTISYEVCSVKMLIICGYFIDNQELIYKGLKENNVIFPAGDFTSYNTSGFERIIKKVIQSNVTEQNKMLKNQKALFDGKQSERFLNLINQLN